MSLLSFIFPASLEFIEKEKITDDVYSFSFKPEKDTEWKAGQHGMIEVKTAKGKTARKMFSLSSAPASNVVRITTHYYGEKSSDFKKALMSLQKGDKAKMRGPVGPLYIRDEEAQNVFIAGGIGITPFISIVEESLLTDKKLRATLLYVNRGEDVAYKDFFDQAAKELDGFSVIYANSNIKKITQEQINETYEDLSKAYFYVSGPPKMIKSYKAELKKIGVSRKRIKNDQFYGYK